MIDPSIVDRPPEELGGIGWAPSPAANRAASLRPQPQAASLSGIAWRKALRDVPGLCVIGLLVLLAIVA